MLVQLIIIARDLERLMMKLLVLEENHLLLPRSQLKERVQQRVKVLLVRNQLHQLLHQERKLLKR